MAAKNVIDYTKCCLYDEKEDSCGLHSKSKLTGLFKCNDLSEVMDYGLSEQSVIESRTKKKFVDGQLICAYHKMKYGKHWCAPKRCLYPYHEEPSTKKAKDRKKDLRKATKEQFEKINTIFPDSFPVSGYLCRTHRDAEFRNQHQVDENDDPTYVPEFVSLESSVPTEDVNELLETSAPDISPVKWHIRSTAVAESSSSTINYHKRKLNEAIENFLKNYSEKVAPGQGEEFLEIIENTTQPKPVIPEDLRLHHEAYQDTQTHSQKVMILSAIPPHHYTKDYIMTTFNCNK